MVNAMMIAHDVTKPTSDREDDMIWLLLSYALRGERDRVERMLNNQTCKSLIERGVIRVES